MAGMIGAIVAIVVMMISSVLWRCSGFNPCALKLNKNFRVEGQLKKSTSSVKGDDDFVEFKIGKPVHQIRWTTEEGDVEFDAIQGELLRTAALRRGVVSPHNGRSKLINCRGLGTCGTCAVEISEGAVEPKKRNSRERTRLSFPPHNPDEQSPLLRLSCQVQVQSDLHVIKHSGFWGQHADLSLSSNHETYLGDLEFLLDNKSPDDFPNSSPR